MPIYIPTSGGNKIVIPNDERGCERVKEFLSEESVETNLEWYMSKLESYKKPLWRGMMRYTKINDALEKKISQLHDDTAFFLDLIDRKKRDIPCLSEIRYILNDRIDDLIRTKPKRKVKKKKGRKVRKGRKVYWWYL